MKKDSWLYSDSFIKRALAIWGYNVVGGLIVGLPIFIVAMVISAIFAAVAMRSFNNYEHIEQGLPMQFQVQ